MTSKMTEKGLERLGANAKGFIEKAERGCVDAYVKAGNELIKAKAAHRKIRMGVLRHVSIAGNEGLQIKKRKWGEWLADQNIPPRTASRAMRYAKEPDRYRKDKVKDALTKREKRKQNGQMSGRKRALLKIIRKATNTEVKAICDLISRSNSLVRLRDMLPEEYRSG